MFDISYKVWFIMSTPHWFDQGSLVLASNNKGKVAEFEKLFEQLKLPVEIIPQGRLNIPDAIEDGLSLLKMRLLKHVMPLKFQANLLWLRLWYLCSSFRWCTWYLLCTLCWRTR